MTTLLELFWIFFKIGLFTIGGGYAMIPLMRSEVVGGGYIDDILFVNMIAVSEATPGPVAVNLATFIGMQVGDGIGGVGYAYLFAFGCTLATVLPCFVIILIVSRLLVKFSDSIAVKGAMRGLRPAVIGLIASAFLAVLCSVVLPRLKLNKISADGFDEFNWISLVLFGCFLGFSRIKIKGKAIHPLIMIVLAAVIGIVLYGFCGIGR